MNKSQHSPFDQIEIPSKDDDAMAELKILCKELDLDLNMIRLKYFYYRTHGRLVGHLVDLTPKPKSGLVKSTKSDGVSVPGAYLKTLLFIRGRVVGNE